MVSLMLLSFFWGCRMKHDVQQEVRTQWPLVIQQDTLLHLPNFSSRHVASRNIEIWLPAGYDYRRVQPYKVIYMQDGQNVFNSETSFTGVDWGVDEALDSMITRGLAQPTVVVAVWNHERFRFSEYMPNVPGILEVNEHALRRHGQSAAGDSLLSDRYLRFLVEEVKPMVEKMVNVSAAPSDVSIMGSSMGGLLSLYAVCRYPQVFGSAACLSTHWVVTNDATDLFLRFLQMHLPAPVNHRFYFDHGSEGKDADYAPLQRRVNEVFSSSGYITERLFGYEYFPGAEHNESAWRSRVKIPLRFLVGKTD